MRSDSYIWHDGQVRSQRSLTPSVTKPSQKRSSIWQTLGYRLMSYFSGSSDPQIRQRTYGNQLVWHVYDPITGREWKFSTEQEVRIWLDERYNQG